MLIGKPNKHEDAVKLKPQAEDEAHAKRASGHDFLTVYGTVVGSGKSLPIERIEASILETFH